jgi:hypothetical protein
MYGKIPTDLWNVPQYLLLGVRLQIKFSKAKSSSYLMNKDVVSETIFKFLDAQLRVNRICPNPTVQVAHNPVLSEGGQAKYITRVELKSFTFSSGSQSLSIDNAVLGQIPKRLLFTVVKNKDFLCTVDTYPYFFRHFDLINFALCVNGKQIPSGGLSLEASHK